MGLWDLITNSNGKITVLENGEPITIYDAQEAQEIAEGDKQLQAVNKPIIQDVRLGDNGEMLTGEEFNKQLAEKVAQQKAQQQATNPSLYDRLTDHLSGGLWGKYETTPTTNQLADGTLATGLETQKVKNGFFDDLNAGMNENFTQNFNPNNWQPNNNKNFANRLGEVLGSTAKILSGPIGESYIAGTDPELAQKLQDRRVGNTLYRQFLEKQGYDTSNLNGAVTKDIVNTLSLNNYRNNNLNYKYYKLDKDTYMKYRNQFITMLNQNMITPQQYLRNMEDLNNAYANEQVLQNEQVQTSNHTRNADINEYLAPHRANALDMGAYSLGVNAQAKQSLLPYQIENLQAQANGGNDAQEKLSSLSAIKGQLDRFSQTFDKVDGSKFNAMQRATGTALGFGNEDEVNFNSQKQLLFNKIARDLGGEKGVLSDQDINRIKQALPSLSDTKAQKQAKMRAVYDLLNDRVKQYGSMQQQQTIVNPNPLNLDL